MSETVFVARQFDKNGSPVVCRFYQPALQSAGEYQCRWSIDWGSGEKSRRSHGLDSVQALLLAMRVAHTELVESEAYEKGALTYLGRRDLDLPPPFSPAD